MTASRSDLAHLMRRAGFGATASELDAAVAVGWDETVSSLLDFSSPDPVADALPIPPMQKLADFFAQHGDNNAEIPIFVTEQYEAFYLLFYWWLQRMAVTAHPLREKLCLLWHNVFATGISKVQRPLWMYNQNQIFRTMGNGNFEGMTQALAKDTAMMYWLDTQTNVAGNPNENFARELMERFTMGVGNFTEDDVREGARCFTGWSIDADDNYVFNAGQHDNGVKTYLGNTGNFNGNDVVHIAVSTPASAKFVTARLWSLLAYPVAASDPVVSDLSPGYAQDLDTTNLLRNIFLHPAFTSTATKTGLVKQPVEWIVGMFRALGMSLSGTPMVLPTLLQLGQIPFDPPDVSGWPANGYWLSTASSLSRWNAAYMAAHLVTAGDISLVTDAPPSGRLDAAAHLLSIDGWSTTTAAALTNAASDPTELMTLALVSPEYVSN